MKRIAKSIVLILLIINTLSCSDEVKAETQNKTTPIQKKKAEPQKGKSDKPNELSEFEQEIQKMLGGAKGEEAVLRKFLKGKEKKENVNLVKAGLDYYVKMYGGRPDKQHIVNTYGTLNLLNTTMRKEVVLKRIEKRLSEQLQKEQKR